MTTGDKQGLSRRTMLGAGAAIGAGLPLAGLGAQTAAATGRGDHATGGAHRASYKAAVSFLQRVTDAYRTSGKRLVQSYQDASGLNDIGFIYDNALTTIALVSAGDLTRAKAIGEALVYAQTHDEKFTDGRLRQAYHADSFVNPDKSAHFGYEFGLVGTAVGDMAWSGIALAHLAHETGDPTYKIATLTIGQWIVTNTRTDEGLGGYTFGETEGLRDHKSTEHNVDVYAYFRLLYKLTKKQVWLDRAAHAWAFVEKVWNEADGFFWTGSDDGAAINKNPKQLPLDVQTWSWIAARQQRYAGALDWASTNLATTDTPLRVNSAVKGNLAPHGVAFASGSLTTDTSTTIGGQSYNPKPDLAAVWYEGTGQLALSLKNRGARQDQDRVDDLLAEIRLAQREFGQGQTFGGKPAPGGIVAASSPLDTGFGFGYYPNLHVAATSWYVFAASGFNPYRFG